eukprot:3888901-Prymnesium_polylepis.1
MSPGMYAHTRVKRVLVDESSTAAATHAAPERVGYLGGHRGPLMEAMLGRGRDVSSGGAGSDDDASAVRVTFSDTSAGAFSSSNSDASPDG